MFGFHGMFSSYNMICGQDFAIAGIVSDFCFKYIQKQIHPYFWLFGLVGNHQFFKHYMESSDGEGLFNLACEGSELLLKIGKANVAEQGTGKRENCISNLADHYDLRTIGTVDADLINFLSILKEGLTDKLLIFDPQDTPQLENDIKDTMSPLMQSMIAIVETIEIGQPIPVCIKRILNAEETPEMKATMKNLRETLNTGDQFIMATDVQLQEQMDNDNNESDNDST